MDFMLRKDTIYIARSSWEPRVPTTEEIQRQVASKQMKLAGSIRLACGKVVGRNTEKERPADVKKG